MSGCRVPAAGGGSPDPRRPQPGGADDGDEGGAAQPRPLQAGGRHPPGRQPQHLEVSDQTSDWFTFLWCLQAAGDLRGGVHRAAGGAEPQQVRGREAAE